MKSDQSSSAAIRLTVLTVRERGRESETDRQTEREREREFTFLSVKTEQGRMKSKQKSHLIHYQNKHVYFRTDKCDYIYFPLPSVCVTIKQYFFFVPVREALFTSHQPRPPKTARGCRVKGYNGHTRSPITL